MAVKAKKKDQAQAQPQTALRAELSYDPTTGEFRRPNGRILSGKQSAGYTSIRFNGRAHLGHRLAWLYVYGAWPRGQLDHINGDRADNRISNLRECSTAENCQNVRAHRDGPGLLGASWSKRDQRWQAGIGINGKRIALGYFDSKEAAHAAYLTAKQQFHTFGGNNGR